MKLKAQSLVFLRGFYVKCLRKSIYSTYNSTEKKVPITGFKICHVHMFLQAVVLTGRTDSSAVEKFKE